MAANVSIKGSGSTEELGHYLGQLRDETIVLALVGVTAAGAAVLGPVVVVADPARGLGLGLGLLVLGLMVWVLRSWSYLGAAILLVAGAMAANLLAAAWVGLDEAIFLLVIPVGLATLTISRGAGIATAAFCTVLVLVAPSWLPSADPRVAVVVIVVIWITLGMVWLTLRPLLRAVRWAWSAYEKGQLLLDQARDYQRQLGETLEDLRGANEQLTRLNRQAQSLRRVAEEERHTKEQFVANVSHELRTPLNMVIGFCEMITQAPETYGEAVPSALLADLDVVLRNSRHLASLIDDVLDLSQVEAGKMAIVRERAGLSRIVRSAAVAVRPLYESKGLRLDLELSPDLPEVFCDRTRIREVVLNLLSNAGRFTARGGVRVRATREGTDVIFSVADTGPGIAAADQDRLFRPFEQLDSGLQRGFRGTGLGLAISKNFVELHQGRMWLESTPGEGTTVSFRLPIDPPEQPQPTPSGRLIPGWEFLQRTQRSRAPAPDIRPRLVVVERGDALRRLVSRYLDGVEVVHVADFDQAIAEHAQTPAHAILVNDLCVGEALARLSGSGSLPSDVPTIICAVAGIEETTSALGVSSYLVKPVSREKLLEALDGLDGEVTSVLVVDDEPDARQLFRRMLAAADRGYRVLRASSGQQALDLMRRERVDAVLLDLVMPEMDGFGMLAVMAEDTQLRDIPVILVSARDPLGQPIVSKALAVTTKGGLSASDLLAGIEALSTLLSKAGPGAGLAPSEAPAD